MTFQWEDRLLKILLVYLIWRQNYYCIMNCCNSYETWVHQQTQADHSGIIKFYFLQNTTIPEKKHIVVISKHIETLLHLPVVTREAAGFIKLATKNNINLGVVSFNILSLMIWFHRSRPVFYLHSSLLKLSKRWDLNFTFNYLKEIHFLSFCFVNSLKQGT